jgi:O-antigen/teichoic acid export membrane protein
LCNDRSSALVTAGKTAEVGEPTRVGNTVARLVGAFAGADAGAGDAKAQRTVVLGTIGAVSLNAFTLIVNFMLAVVLARTLGTSGYGAYAVALAWNMLLAVPASLGIGPLVVRHVAVYTERAEWGRLRGVVRRSNQAVLTASIAVMGVAGAVALSLADTRPEIVQPFLIGLPLIPLISLTLLRHAAIQGLHRVVLARLPDTVVMPGSYLVFALIAAWALGGRFTATWAIALNVSAAAIAFAVGAALLRWSLPAGVRQSKPEYEQRDWARSAVPLLVMSMLLTLNNQIGTILLGALDSADAAGTFNVAVRIAMFTSFLFLAATYPLLPNVARLWTVGDRVAIQRLVTRAIRVVAIFSVVVAVALVALAPQILGIFGGEFSGGATALRILVVGELVKVLMGFGGIALVMTAKESIMARGVGLGVALNVVLALALIPVWSANGAATASTVSALASSAYIAWLTLRQLGIYAPAIGRSSSADRGEPGLSG